jgi:serine-type D-Ala-D-Ala carboxypeptidase (penicillin-binding protein 5/6)
MITGISSIPTKRKLKIYRLILYFLIFFFLSAIFLFIIPGKIFCETYNAIYNEEIDISAESAVIVNYETGDILWEKNSSEKLYPASLTKMLSSIVAIENIDDLEEVVRIPANASGRNHSAFRFRTGDRVTLLDLIKSSLICSHNNAIVALAEYISGSEEEFIKLMNEKSMEIGAYETFFRNTNGLDSEFPDHKSTAADLAKIAAYCMKNDLFSEIVGTKTDIIKRNEEEIEIQNTNNLLEYNYVKGIKTGYTNNAGCCIALFSEKDGLKLVTVILKDETLEERNDDALKLLSWAYDNLKYTKVVDSGKPAVTVIAGSHTVLDIDLYPETDYVDLINISSDVVDTRNRVVKDITLPVRKNEAIGSMDILINGKKIKEIDLISHENIESGYIYQELSEEESGKTIYIIISVIVFYFLIFLTIIVRNLILRKKL